MWRELGLKPRPDRRIGHFVTGVWHVNTPESLVRHRHRHRHRPLYRTQFTRFKGQFPEFTTVIRRNSFFTRLTFLNQGWQKLFDPDVQRNTVAPLRVFLVLIFHKKSSCLFQEFYFPDVLDYNLIPGQNLHENDCYFRTLGHYGTLRWLTVLPVFPPRRECHILPAGFSRMWPRCQVSQNTTHNIRRTLSQ